MGRSDEVFPPTIPPFSWKAIMPRSTKANLPWIDAVGSKIAGGLSERYARPMIYRQSGPYNQSKTPHVGIFFNDPILHHIASVNPAHKVDFRFGFYLERCFSSEIDDYVIIAGFKMLNPTLSARFLMPNLRADYAAVALKLIAWLRRHGANGGYVRFGISDGQRYIADGEDGQDDLADALLVYASPGRKAESFTWRRAQFSAIVHFPKYSGWRRCCMKGFAL